MRHVLGPLPLGDLHLFAGDAGPGQGGAQEVAVLVHGTGLDGGPDELFHELLADVLDEHLWGQEPVWGRSLDKDGAQPEDGAPSPQVAGILYGGCC